MMEFIKKQSIAFYVSVVAVILAVVSLIIYAINSGNVYFSDVHTGTAILVMTVFAIILDLAVIVASQFFKDNKIIKVVMDVAMVVITILLMCSLMLFVKDRVYYMAIVFGSELESDNPAAWSAMYQSIVGMIFYAITIILSIVAAFFNFRKADKA